MVEHENHLPRARARKVKLDEYRVLVWVYTYVRNHRETPTEAQIFRGVGLRADQFGLVVRKLHKDGFLAHGVDGTKNKTRLTGSGKARIHEFSGRTLKRDDCDLGLSPLSRVILAKELGA